MTAPRRFYLVRHGETDWNVAGRLQGRRDIPLNSLGRAQAARVGHVLHNLAGDVTRLTYVSSPMSRALETMRILRTTLDLPMSDFSHDPQLAELAFGQWEGMTWPDLRRRDPELVKQRELDPWSFVPPDGESYQQLSVRAGAALDRIPGNAVVVTHGGVIRSMLHSRAGMPAEEACTIPIRQGAIYVLEAGAYALKS